MTTLHYNTLRNRVEAVRWSIWRRAQALTVAAGLDSAGTLHNAMISLNQGRPWAGVDYRKATEAHRLFDRQFAAHNWLRRFYENRGPHAFDWSATP